MRIGMSGHQDIPEQAISFVKRRISGIVSQVTDDLIGVSSLAAGADQLFASLILEHGGELHIIIPSDGYETTFSVPHDLNQFRSLLQRAQTIEKLPYSQPSEEAFWAAGCQVVDKSDLLIAVWDGQPAKGKGGTADVVEYARSRGAKVKVIWPAGVIR